MEYIPEKEEVAGELHLRDFSSDLAAAVSLSAQVNIMLHTHDYYEIVYVSEGFCLHRCENEVNLIMEGDILAIKPGMRHQYIGERLCKVCNCMFMPAVFGSFLPMLSAIPGLKLLFSAQNSENIPRVHLDFLQQKSADSCIRAMVEEAARKQDGWQLRFLAQLTLLLTGYARAYEQLHSQSDTKIYSGYISQALKCIDSRYADPALSVIQIGEAAGVSGDYLSRQFKKALGVSVLEYLRRYRFARAIALLQQDTPVSEAARRVGFASVGYFSREFKKETGMMPSQYKKADR